MATQRSGGLRNTRKRGISPNSRSGRDRTPDRMLARLEVYDKCPLLDKTSIRIFEIWPNPDVNSMVEGSLVVWDAQKREQEGYDEDSDELTSPMGSHYTEGFDDETDMPGYEALSYAWGTSKPSSEIRIFVQDKPYNFLVTPSLESALKHFRHRYTEKRRNLWIDAICINQDNYQEKNVQVALMSTIFKEASNVCVWLGQATENSHLAFRLINRMVDLSDFDELVQDIDQIKLLDEFSKLMSREWFGRRWVVQEIGLAKRATLHCGDQKESWAKFANAVALFQNAELSNQSISYLFRSSSDYHHRTDILGDVRFLGASRLVEATSKLFRKSSDGKILDHLLPLESLVAQLTNFQASDRRDTIYSVLSLARDTQSSEEVEDSEEARKDRQLFEKLSLRAQQNVMLLSKVSQRRLFQVDYTKSFFEVCRDFLEFAITGSRSLDIICRPWAPGPNDRYGKSHENLPSWIPMLENAAFGKRPDGRYIRINADPLVGDPGSSRRNYNAAMDTKAYHIRFGNGSNSRSLHVVGMQVDEIGKLQGEALAGNISNAWLRFGGWKDRTADPPEEFWRTLVADRGPQGENPPVYYALACKYAFHQGPPNAALNPELIMRSGISSIGKEYLKRMQEVVWNKRLMRSREFGRLGLTPGTAEEGDWICILYGCSVPVILRPTKEIDPGYPRENRRLPPFELIGECYMHGMMDGEVFNLKHKQRIKETFELV